MKKLILIILVLVLFGCNEKQTNSFEPNVLPGIESESVKYNSFNLNINNPTVIDSSNWVLYPLVYNEFEVTDKGFESSSYRGQHAFWNVLFYNTETKQTRLLSDSLKMLINSISPNSGTVNHSGQRTSKNERLIFYSITTTDFNEDQEINSKDPKYLFISDLSGNDFKQISPDNFNLIYWKTINRTNKILIQARRDSNNDKSYTIEDEVVSFVYDLKGEKLKEVFDASINLKTKKLLEKHWAKTK